MTPLLGPDAFPGDWISAQRAGASFVGEAYFDGVIVFTDWSRDAVVAMLAPGWELAPNVSAAPQRHPVVFALGRQRRTAVLFGGLTLRSDADYHEVLIAVPFVRHTSGRHLHTFVPRMYSADERATWAGDTYYGFGKCRAAFERFGSTLTVSAPDVGLLLHSTVHGTDSWRRGGDGSDMPVFVALQDTFRLPILGVKPDGREIESYFEWRFDTATVRSIATDVTLDTTVAPGLGPATCRMAAGGALEVRGMRWRLSWPEECRR